MTDFLKRNLPWMVFSLLVATVLWAIITVQQNPEETDFFPVIPVSVENIPNGLVLRNRVDPVGIRVTAPRDVWPTLTQGSFRAIVDASNTVEGVQLLTIRVIPADSRAHVDSVEPARVIVQLEAWEEKSVTVRVNTVGNPAFGYIAKSALVAPSQVTVSGPKSAVDEVAVATVEINVEGLKKRISDAFKPVARASSGRLIEGVTIDPETVFVEVPVEQELGYKTVPIAPQVVGMVGLGYQIIGIIVDPSTVTLVGDPEVLEGIDFVATKPVAVDGALRDLTRNAELPLPQGVSLSRSQDIVVRVFVSPVESSKVLQVAPTVVGLSKAMRGVVTPSSIEVMVSGPMPVLSTMRAQDIQVLADVSKLKAGSYSVPITVTVPSALRLDDYNPKEVSVFLKPVEGLPVE